MLLCMQSIFESHACYQIKTQILVPQSPNPHHSLQGEKPLMDPLRHKPRPDPDPEDPDYSQTQDPNQNKTRPTKIENQSKTDLTRVKLNHSSPYLFKSQVQTLNKQFRFRLSPKCRLQDSKTDTDQVPLRPRPRPSL